MRLLPAALVLAFTLSSWGRAHAQPGNTAPGQTAPHRAYLPVPQLERPLPPPTQTVSYGMHVFAADIATWVLLAAASGSESDELAVFGGAGLLLGGPIVHLAHGNANGALLSVLARGGLPLLGGVLMSATCSDEERDEFLGCLGHFAAGMVIGYGTALVIDWFYLAKKQERIAATGWASLSPSLNVQRQGVHAGLAGAF